MGRRIRAKISGIAGYVPPQVMTNADLEKIVDTNDEWIRTRTGIRERHVAEKGVATSPV
jgi:3-oxoacyl-[acyl-carrier-protein] synthase-3